MKLIKYILAGIIMLVAGSTVFAQKNLVLNGGFENELEGWVDYSAKVTPYMYSAGKMSAALFSSDSSKWMGMHQVVSLPKNTQYMLMSAKIKADGVSTGKNAWNGALFLFEMLNKQEAKIGEGINIASVTGDEDWKLYEKAYIIPPGVTKIKFLFALGYVTGTMFVDEVSLKVLTQSEFEKYL
ncbi:carbohydrate binding domain-containing protein [Pedobacter sp. PF22-3]|uniref:carbohydrate binding domain-containing protein n=1 Tax=Pedobacter sp. PF22-3 TaxID=2994467 RepID=UPI002245BC0F|nr:carbohydrate binding domain-containing protein [Pedobacter sp. PF22-3]MCX2493869.1 carbohydrate binding domain-containing protein [Pedobacter sp. PF22-3]